LEAFKQYMSQRRYAAKTVATCLRCITHFAQWANFGHRRRQRIDEGLIAEFVDERPTYGPIGPSAKPSMSVRWERRLPITIPEVTLTRVA
jgi:hypothetical protein